MSSIYIPTSSSSSSATIEYIDQVVQPLATQIGTATSDNVANTIVKRDANKDFSASKIRLFHLESVGPTLSIAGDNTTNTLNIGSGTGVQSVNIGNNGTGATTIQVGGSGDTVNVGTSTSRAGAVTMYPDSLNLNSSVTNNVASLADLNLGMVYNGGNPASNFVSSSGRILMNATAHNTVQGRKNIPAGFQVRVLQNGTSPSKSVLSFLGSETVFGNVITECGSIDSDGMFKCSSVESRGTTLNIAGQDNTNTLNIGSGTGVQTINMGNNGVGATTINLGGGSDIVKVNLPLRDSANNTVFNTVLGAVGTFGDGSVFVGNIGVPQGKGNTYVGTQISSETSSTKFGEYNTGMGSMALNSIETGALNNVAIGHRAFAGLRNGSDNVAIGTRAGHSIPNSSQRLMTGSNCIFIGTDARPTATDLVNATAIGTNALVDGNNTIQLGNTSVTDVKTSGTIRAAGLESIGTTLTIAGQNNTSVVDIGKGTGVQTINMGNNGAGATTINIGGGTDIVNFAGAEHKFTGAVQVTGVGAGTIRARSLIQVDAWIPIAGQGAGIGWNRTGGTGYTTFVNQQGLGTGGWEWINYKNDNTLTSADPQMVLDSGGNLSVTGGLKLPSTGGTAGTLNHYEEYDFTTSFTGCANFPGIQISLVRIGRQVTMSVKSYSSFQATSTGYFISATAIPPSFRPTFEQHQQIGIYITSTGDEQSNGVASITSGGIIRVGDKNYLVFSSGEYGGFAPFGISWVI